MLEGKTKVPKKPYLIKLAFLIFLAAGFVFFSTLANALYVDNSPQNNSSEKVVLSSCSNPEASSNIPLPSHYASGQFIVKFKKDAGSQVNQNIRRDTLRLTPRKTGLASIDALNTKHKVVEIIPLVKELKEKQLKTNKTNEELFQEIKQKYPERAKRAPKNQNIPNLTDIYLIKLTDNKANLALICAEYQKDPNVEYAEPDYEVKVQIIPNDPYFSSSGTWGQSYRDMWGLEKIRTQQAWDIETGSPNITVAVIDTGVDYNHPDIDKVNTMWTDDQGHYGYDYVNNDSDPIDDFGHGTHVAGTIAGFTNNSIGISSISWHSKIMAVKGFDNHGSGYDSWLVACINYAVENGADILSNSWGGFGNSQALADAFQTAYDVGCVNVAAAGNSNMDARYFSPANLSTVITVSAFDVNDQKASFSNYGTKIDVAAPGVDILSLRANGTDMYNDGGTHIVGNYYYRADGTSMACPQVSGLAALILSLRPDFTNEQVREVIRTAADDVDAPDFDLNSGYGRINAYEALQIAKATASGGICIAHFAMSSGTDNPWYLPSMVQGQPFEITGSAYSTQEGYFSGYKIEYGEGNNPTVWNQIAYSTTPVENGALATWNTSNLTLYQTYCLKLTVTGSESNTFEDRIMVVYVPQDALLQYKWTYYTPVKGGMFPTYPTGAAAIADIYPDNNHPGLETVLADNSGNQIICLDENGIPIWVQHYISSQHFSPNPSSPAVADIDLDGHLEILILLVEQIPKLACLNYDGSIRWQADLPGSWSGQTSFTPLVADFVPESPGLEIVVGTYDGKVLCFDKGGKQVWQFEKYTGYFYGSFASADIDGDGKLEIIAPLTLPNESEGGVYIYCLEGNGSLDWEYNLIQGHAGMRQCPALGDMNSDNYIDILAQEIGASLYCFDSGVTGLLWKDNLCLPVSAILYPPYSSPAVGDLDGDGNLEVIATDVFGGAIYCIDKDGHTRWTQNNIVPTSHSSPALADLNGDGNLEIVIGSDYDGIYVLNKDGTPVYWYMTGTPVWSSPVIADIDGDNKLEIVVTDYYGTTYVLTCPVTYNGDSSPWPKFHRDLCNTGKANSNPVLTPIGDKLVYGAHTLSFQVTATDEDNDQLSYSASGLPNGATFNTTTHIFSWTPSAYINDCTNYVTFTVTDSYGVSDSEVVTITAKPDRVPVFGQIPNQSIARGHLLTFRVHATDPDGDQVTYGFAPGYQPSGATINPNTGVFQWTPTLLQRGSNMVVFSAKDPYAVCTNYTIVINVTNNQPK